MLKRIAALTTVSVLLTSCAIHPIPDQTTGYSTYQIVRKVRCEARDALVEKFKILLYNEPQDAYANVVLAHIDEPRYRIALNRFDADTKENIAKFAGSAIGYNFTFDISETNNAGFSIGFLDTFTRGAATLGLGASENRTRQNIRTFTVTDTFEGLLVKLRPDYCHDLDTKLLNYQYPIAGNIGINEEIGTFIDLSLNGALVGKEPNGPPTMADTIRFTTTVSGSANPHILLAPLKQVAQVASADFSLSSSRADVHSVIVALSLPVAADARKALKTLSNEFVTVSGTPAEQAVGQAISQQILRFETGNRPVILSGSTILQ